VSQPGDWTFIVRSDDGFRLRMGAANAVVMEQINPRPPGDSAVAVKFLAAGYYPYRLTYFEWAGGAQVEFSARPPGGVDKLVGDQGGPLQVFQDLNSPPVLPTQSNRTAFERTVLVVTNTATDTDLQANPLTYTLLVAPGGSFIRPDGVITWLPSELHGSTTNVFIT